MKAIDIFAWFGLCCWIAACIVAIYQQIIGEINVYEMITPVIAFMVYYVMFKDELKRS